MWEETEPVSMGQDLVMRKYNNKLAWGRQNETCDTK